MITHIASAGNLSIDIYSQKVAECLPINTLYTDYFQEVMVRRVAGQKPYQFLELMRGFAFDRRILRTFQCQDGALHFSHQHFGRFGHFLRRPFLITCHDIIRYLDMHEKTVLQKRPKGRGKMYLTLDFSGLKKASKILAISNYTKLDLMTHLGVKEQNIEVVYPGIDHAVFHPTYNISLRSFPYILYTGSEVPRKNFFLLLEAFKKLKGNRQFRNLKLIKVGDSGDVNLRAMAVERIRAFGLESDVIFVGYISDKLLAQYYTMAQCFVFPSLYEGFGMPPLEAMACGCPTIVSNWTSLPEVVGDAGIKLNPTDSNELASAIGQVLTESDLRKSLVSRGLERASLFTWQKCASNIYDIYKREGYI